MDGAQTVTEWFSYDLYASVTQPGGRTTTYNYPWATLEGVDGTSPLAEIAALDARLRAVLLEWELRSTLELPAAGTGRHAPVALVFPGPAGPVEVPVSASAPVTAATGVTATVSWPGGEPRVTVSDHALGVPFGRYALDATRAILEAAYGTPEPRDVLGQLLDCSALAVSLAARCVGPVCVGHEAELGEICEGGLDEAAARLEARILALDYEAIRLDEGSADAEGAALDLLGGTASATRLSGGVWSAAVDLGEGPVAAQGTFAAAAVP